MPQLRLLFFGRLADIAGAERNIDPSGLTDIASVIDHLGTAMPAIGPLLHPDKCRYVLDQQIVAADMAVAGSQELAFLPPVSGG